MDSLTKEKRSWNMSRIRSNDTKPELKVRSFLFRQGFRFRLHVKDLPGKPDIILPKYKTIIEVRGCFWHRHPRCKEATTPSTNASFWNEKFHRNVERDQRTERKLKDLGWKLIVVWECETTKKNFPPSLLLDFVRNNCSIAKVSMSSEFCKSGKAHDKKMTKPCKEDTPHNRIKNRCGIDESLPTTYCCGAFQYPQTAQDECRTLK